MNAIEFNGCSYLLKLDASEASWSLFLKKDDQLILKGNSLLMMTPLMTDCYLGEGRIYDIGIQPGGSRLVRIVATISGALHGEVVNEIYMYADRVVCESHYMLDSEHSLEHWCMSGSGGFLGEDAIHAYTGIHGGRDVNGQCYRISPIQLRGLLFPMEIERQDSHPRAEASNASLQNNLP